jgi:hypothetical protein
MDTDLEILLENLKYCLNKANELSKLSVGDTADLSSSSLSLPTNPMEMSDLNVSLTKLLNDTLITSILNNAVIVENAFGSSQIIHFLID